MLKNKWFWIGVTGILVAVLGIGVFALTQVDNVMAAAVEYGAENIFGKGPGGRGRGRDAGMGGFEMDEALANYLGMAEDEVEAAYEAAAEAAYAQAVEEGLIDEDQAKDFGGRGMVFGMSGKHANMIGGLCDGCDQFGIDFQALLADELGISVAELEEAYEAIQAEYQAYQIEQGNLTEDDIALMEARQAVMEYVDVEAALEEKLGITLQELQDARQNGGNGSDLLSELDLSFGDIQDAVQETMEEAVALALQDGAITQEQADELLENGLMGVGFGRGGPGMRGSEKSPDTGNGFREGGSQHTMPHHNWDNE